MTNALLGQIGFFRMAHRHSIVCYRPLKGNVDFTASISLHETLVRYLPVAC